MAWPSQDDLTQEDETSEQLYVIANQLNLGVSAVTSEAQRERIVAVNLSAGRRARTAVACNAAITYLEVARELLGDQAHPSRSPTAFAIALLRAECELLVGHLDVAETQLLLLSQSCSNLQASAGRNNKAPGAPLHRRERNTSAPVECLSRVLAPCCKD